jgi:hypothetical protein
MTSGSSISAPNNFAFDPTGSEISINAAGITAMTASNAIGTTYDGATPLLSASARITPGMHALYLAIFDQGDQSLDSAVFLDNLRIGYVPNPEVNCVAGARPKNYALSLDPGSAENPTGTTHTVTAALLEEGAALAAAAISFRVTGAHVESGAGSTDATGQVSFSYTGTGAGSDAISACYDADNDGACEAVASATKTWIMLAACGNGIVEGEG